MKDIKGLNYGMPGGPPDSALRALEAAGKRLMGSGGDGMSTFTSVALVGAYLVGKSANDASPVAGGCYLNHPEYPEGVPLLVRKLRRIADDIERDHNTRREMAS